MRQVSDGTQGIGEAGCGSRQQRDEDRLPRDIMHISACVHVPLSPQRKQVFRYVDIHTSMQTHVCEVRERESVCVCVCVCVRAHARGHDVTSMTPMIIQMCGII
jgi:hypothetical protein